VRERSGQSTASTTYYLTAPFDRGLLAKAVETVGAKIIQGVAAGIDFLEVNGIHVQITPLARG
jgi:hypothetical protein